METQTPDFRYDSYCGLYCGACDILQTYKRHRARGTTPHWDELPEPLRKHVPHGEIECHGCKSDTVFIGCQKCPYKACARKKQVESCRTCDKYPCLIHHIANIVKKLQRLERKLPHLQGIPENLATIEQVGTEAWLTQQERRWTCPQCGAAATWYQSRCVQCGNPLESYKRILA